MPFLLVLLVLIVNTVKIALREALRPSKTTKRKTKTTYLQVNKTKGETLSNIRGRNDGSKRQRNVASNRPGLDFFSG